MLKRLTKSLLKPHAEGWVKDAGIEAHGIRNLMTWAKRYNRWVYATKRTAHDRAYREERTTLLEKHGPEPARAPVIMQDGWALDTTGSLPHLDALLRDANQIVEERGGRKHTDIQQPFLRNLISPGDLDTYPSILDFITSRAVLTTVMDYMKTVPVLSRTRPPGARFMESNADLDPGAGGVLRASQYYHLDIHDSPLVYVLVAVRDITATSGPWTFLPDAASSRAAQGMDYHQKGAGYRVTDERMYSVVDESQAISFALPKGSVLFIDSSRCFHYGSRDARPPRFLFMYGLTSVCRGDFSETYMKPIRYPVPANASRLRQMVCS